MATPADLEEPRARSDAGPGERVEGGDRDREAVECFGGGAWVGEGLAGDDERMLVGIQEDILNRVSNFRGGAEVVAMVPVGPKASASIQEPIHGASDANLQSREVTCELVAVARLDDEVHVIRLHGEVNDLKGGFVPARSPLGA